MNETPRVETPVRPRRRGRRALLALVLLLTGAAGIGLWRQFRDPLSDEERQLVGTWSLRWDNAPMKLELRYEFRPDRTCHITSWDAKTGAVYSDLSDQSWRLTGAKLIVRRPGAAAGPRFLPASLRAVDEELTLTPEGPGRFRYSGVVKVRSTPTGPPVTGSMTRIGPAE
jgi:hypothetical protein